MPQREKLNKYPMAKDEEVIETQAAPKKRGRPRKATPPPVKNKDDEDTDKESDPEELDEKGEDKVDANGYLKGGREYRFLTFNLPRHESRLYLYSLDASKLLGFRDTYIFFLRNPNVKRINGTEEDRASLDAQNLLPSSIRNRPITLVRARDIFKAFGHKVIRRGRPVRDDYYVGNQSEPDYTDDMKMDEDENSYSLLDYTKLPQTLGGGPYRRHGISLAGFSKPELEFETFEPKGAVPKELSKDAWMYKCALSAADFNQRLNRNRPVSFLDLHTNVEQIASSSQPARVTIEMERGSHHRLASSKKVLVDTSVVCDRVADPRWQIVSDSLEPSLYPLAIARNQYQETYPVYPVRFQDPTAQEAEEELQKLEELGPRIEPYDLPPTLMGAIPYKVAVQTVNVRKRGRPKKDVDGEEDQVE